MPATHSTRSASPPTPRATYMSPALPTTLSRSAVLPMPASPPQHQHPTQPVTDRRQQKLQRAGLHDPFHQHASRSALTTRRATMDEAAGSGGPVPRAETRTSPESAPG